MDKWRWGVCFFIFFLGKISFHKKNILILSSKLSKKSLANTLHYKLIPSPIIHSYTPHIYIHPPDLP